MDLFALSAKLTLDTSDYEKGLNDAKSKGETIGSKIGSGIAKGIGSALKVVGKYSLEFGKDIIETGLEFDKVMGGVNAVTNTVDEYSKAVLRAAVVEEARSSAFTAAEVAQAAYYEGLAGYTFDEVINGLHGIVVLAEASGEPMAAVADIITDAVTAFGEGADAQTRFADVLAATATSTNTDVRKIGNAFKYVAPLAGALNYSLEDVAIALGVMADQGIKGSQAGTTLRNIFTRLAADTSGARTDALYSQLGVDFFDQATGKARPFLDIVKDIREVWGGFTLGQQRNITKMFGDFITEGTDANTVLEESKNTMDEWREEYSKLETTAEKNKFLESIGYYKWNPSSKKYEQGTLAEQLGIYSGVDTYNNDIWITNKDFLEVLDQIEAKYEDMTDEQKISFAYQMASMRGMSGFLALVNIADDEFNEIIENVENAEGAADRMRETRLDSLWGDIEIFKSHYDAFKTQAYDSVNSPLRALVKAATNSLDNVIDAFNSDGWVAGIQTAFSEVRPLYEEYVKPIIEEASPLIGDALATALEWFLQDGAWILMEIGVSLGKGIIGGMSKALVESEDPLIKGLGAILSPLAAVANGVDEAIAAGKNKTAKDALVEAFADPGEAIDEMLTSDVSLAGTLANMFTGKNKVAYKKAANEEYSAAMASLYSGASTGIDPTESLYGIDVDAEKTANVGEEILNGILTVVALGSTDVGASLIDGMSDTASITAGEVGDTIWGFLTSFFDSNPIYVPIIPDYSGLDGLETDYSGGSRSFAQGMSGGRILRGSTIFGVGADGRPLTGGESGPEAVVGVSSLNQMIHESVNNAMGGMLGSMLSVLQEIRQSMPTGSLVLDTGALVGGIMPTVDEQMNERAKWRGYGRS